MAPIHELVYQSTDLKRIDFGNYIESLSLQLFNTYITDPNQIKLKINVDNILLNIKTTLTFGFDIK